MTIKSWTLSRLKRSSHRSRSPSRRWGMLDVPEKRRGRPKPSDETSLSLPSLEAPSLASSYLFESDRRKSKRRALGYVTRVESGSNEEVSEDESSVSLPSASATSLTLYQYLNPHENQIRLLQIVSIGMTQRVRCVLRRFRLSEAPEYKAVSYA